jgi:hypothetical protein
MDKKNFINSFFCGTFALVLGFVFFLCLCYGAPGTKSSLLVKNSVFSQPLNSQYKKFQGEIMLPMQGYWRIVRTNQAENITEIYLVPSTPMSDEEIGGRVTAVIENKQTERGHYFLQQLFWPCKEYAKKHNNIGPSSLQDLDPEKDKYLLKSLSSSPFDKIEGQDVEGPFVFLVPEVPFHFEKIGEYVLEKNKEVLAWELRPYVDDGKHWVLYTNDSCIRQPIDTRLMKKYQQVIRPVKRKKKEMAKKMPGERSYSIAAVCKEMPKIPLLITLENVYSGETIEIKWDMNKACQLERGKSVDLKGVRTTAWLSYSIFSHSPIITTWLFTLDKKKIVDLFPYSIPRYRETLSVFDILGGRAAVRETLQLQVLNARTPTSKEENYTIALESLEGVKVKSHPFREMLKKNSVKVKELPLANLAPHDHFFVYMANPRDILAFLDKGCEFLHRVGTTFTGNGVDYGLDKKYLQRLGFNKQLLRALLEAGSILECALVFPDLFFIDGTDITVVSRLKRPGQVSALLTLIGLNELPPKGIITHKLKDGNSVYWSIWDDLLMVSTSKSELDKVLQLKAKEGKGSLGQSEEFQYMLTQLPITESTWSYAYLSDPFIRHLVSPAVKIGQLRRIRARADMEFLTACALLANLDGMKSPWSIKNLVEYKYIPETYLEGDYYFDQNHILHSNTYGILSNMKTLSQVPIDRVSREEEKAYKRYVEVYSDYWRQFFDPIALRLDETADGFLEAEVFILPLANNSFYNFLKTALKRKEDNTEFKIPKLSIDPVIMLSLNLGDEAWKGILRDSYDMLHRYIPLHPAIFEDFGPGLHLAVHDADPVIALGSGDVLGAFGANFISGVGGGILSVPVLLSVLTRPCTLVIETQNPQRTLNYLKQAVPAAGMGRPDWEFNVRVHQVEDRDQWVFSFNLAGLIKLRFSVELQDEFVLIRNIPWSHNEKIVSVEKTGLKSASLITYPDACDLQLPGLFEADQDRSLFTALQGVGRLYPLVASGYASIEDAAEKHEALFGFAPKHPGNGRFLWSNFHLESSTYGSVFYQRQPAYKKGDTNFGVMAGFQYLGVSMQFEDSGLRTKCRWKMTR